MSFRNDRSKSIADVDLVRVGVKIARRVVHQGEVGANLRRVETAMKVSSLEIFWRWFAGESRLGWSLIINGF